MPWTLSCSLVLAACGCLDLPSIPTTPGVTYAQTSLGCLDLAVARVTRGYTRGPVIEYAFINGCTHHTALDLTRVRVHARAEDGTDRELVAYDPRGELVASAVPALERGVLRVEYRDRAPAPEGRLAQVCVDVGAVAGAGESARWLCMAGGR